ncbi:MULTISPECIES: hypothetical protein [unclassified Luteibacter]|uniref:hypothetical protein n=1 Tax=Luteibacter sp. PvP019 TaxID=3156436 RepID=UPI0033919893
MFSPLVDSAEIRGWATLSGDDTERPFEHTVGRACTFFSYSDYTALFLPETIRGACAWSAGNDSRPFAMFFTIPDPADYWANAGSFGGLVATGTDDPGAIESFLMQDDRAGPSLSPYDTSHRFIILPDDRSWMWIGDRDADLAIFGFTTEGLQRQFVSGAGFRMFASLDEAASHAKSFMNYSVDKACLS